MTPPFRSQTAWRLQRTSENMQTPLSPRGQRPEQVSAPHPPLNMKTSADGPEALQDRKLMKLMKLTRCALWRRKLLPAATVNQTPTQATNVFAGSTSRHVMESHSEHFQNQETQINNLKVWCGGGTSENEEHAHESVTSQNIMDEDHQDKASGRRGLLSPVQ